MLDTRLVNRTGKVLVPLVSRLKEKRLCPGWTLMLGLTGVPAATALLALPFSPESPSHLLVQRGEPGASRERGKRLGRRGGGAVRDASGGPVGGGRAEAAVPAVPSPAADVHRCLEHGPAAARGQRGEWTPAPPPHQPIGADLLRLYPSPTFTTTTTLTASTPRPPGQSCAWVQQKGKTTEPSGSPVISAGSTILLHWGTETCPWRKGGRRPRPSEPTARWFSPQARVTVCYRKDCETCPLVNTKVRKHPERLFTLFIDAESVVVVDGRGLHI